MELSEKISELELLAQLWARHCIPVLAEQVQERVGMTIRKPVTPDTLYVQEFTKGECVGLELSSALPQTLLEEAKRDLELLNKEIENDGK